MNKINQRLHELAGNLGLLRTTNCIERGCEKYHGTSPSQKMIFEHSGLGEIWLDTFKGAK